MCLSIYNEALSGVRVYLYKPYYSRQRENVKLGEQNCQRTAKLIKHETWRQVNIYEEQGNRYLLGGLLLQDKHHNYKTTKLDLFKKNLVPKL